jgi:hypothetical protein
MAQHTLIVEQATAPEANKKRRKAPLILAGIGVIALVPLIGSTFAASISLNSGSNVEFGQGTQTAAACDASISTALSAVVQSGAFSDTTLTLSDIDVSSGHCGGKKLVIRIADSSNVLVDLGGSTVKTCTVTVPTSTNASATATGCTANVTVTSNVASAVIDFTSTVAPTSVSKILIESTD